MHKTKITFDKFMLSARFCATILAFMLIMLILGLSINGILGDLLMIISSSTITLVSLAFSGYGFYVQNQLKNQF